MLAILLRTPKLSHHQSSSAPTWVIFPTLSRRKSLQSLQFPSHQLLLILAICLLRETHLRMTKISAMLSPLTQLAMPRAPSAHGASLLLSSHLATPSRTPRLFHPPSSSAPTLETPTIDSSSRNLKPLWRKLSRNLIRLLTDLNNTCQDSTDKTSTNS